MEMSSDADGNCINLEPVHMDIHAVSVQDWADARLARGRPSRRTNVRTSGKFPKRRQFIPTATFWWFDWVTCTLSVLLFTIDIVTDIRLAVIYFQTEMWIYAGITTALIVGPSLVICFIGLHWYIVDHHEEVRVAEEQRKQGIPIYITPRHIRFLQIFFTALQCGPVIRTVDYLRFGHKSQERGIKAEESDLFYRLMLYADVDGGLLRLFESFLESAPQLTWQLYLAIVLKPGDDVVGTVMRTTALLSSWSSLAISQVCYHRALRNSQEEKAKMAWPSIPCYFIWRACEIGTRVLCIAMFASVFNYWVFAILIFHWVFMSVWLRTTFYDKEEGKKYEIYLEYVLSFICGYAMMFCFFNLREGHTRFRVLLFYIMFYVENFFMLTFWVCFSRDLDAWFYLWGAIAVSVLCILHIVFQLLYYALFHPTKNIKLCLPCNRYVLCSSLCDSVPTDSY